MAEKTQKFAIRLLNDGVTPETAVREGVELEDWAAFERAKIAARSMGGTPKSSSATYLLPSRSRSRTRGRSH